MHPLIIFAMLSAVDGTASPTLEHCPPVEVFAPGVVSREGIWPWRLAFDKTFDRIYWAESRGWWPGTREKAVIMTATAASEGGWSTPRPASFSGRHADMDPFVSPDGRWLVFSSMRPVEGIARVDMDLWMAPREGSGWGEPVHLGYEVNAAGFDELYPSMDLDGTLYFARVCAPEPGGDVDIWRSRRGADGRYGTPERLGWRINTADRWEYNPEISPDGRTLLFVRLDRPGDDAGDAGHGWGDLYLSERDGDDFGPARNLGPCINGPADEYHPTMRWDRDELYFVRNDDGRRTVLRTRLRPSP